MKERVGDEKLIIISVAVRGINDHIRFYSQMLCTAAVNTSNTTNTDRCRRTLIQQSGFLFVLLCDFYSSAKEAYTITKRDDILSAIKAYMTSTSFYYQFQTPVSQYWYQQSPETPV